MGFYCCCQALNRGWVNTPCDYHSEFTSQGFSPPESDWYWQYTKFRPTKQAGSYKVCFVCHESHEFYGDHKETVHWKLMRNNMSDSEWAKNMSDLARPKIVLPHFHKIVHAWLKLPSSDSAVWLYHTPHRIPCIFILIFVCPLEYMGFFIIDPQKQLYSYLCGDYW